MEYVIFGVGALLFIIAIIAKDIYNDRKKQKEFLQKLRNDFGKSPKKEIKPERWIRLGSYYEKHKETGQIDDITWNDLGMDEIYKMLDCTHSATGEEYLYYSLRSPNRSLEELEELENMIGFFRNNEDARVAVQLLMAKLGYMGKFSLYDYLDHLDYLGERSNRASYVGNALLLGCIACLPFFTSYALIGVVAVTIFNIMTYFKQKSDIEPYVISFVYVLKMLTAAEKLEKIKELGDEAIFQKDYANLRELCNKLSNLKKGSFWVTSGRGSLNGNPADMIVDYVKMSFHVDLIRFNQMLKFLRQNVKVVDEINTILGKYETMIAVGSWRCLAERKNGYCVPKLRENGGLDLKMEEGYHPLLSEPVKNSLEARRGILLTGSNASGKSTFLKTIAINAVLAQSIHTCAATSYSAPCFRIYSSMSLRDDVENGDSYYVVEIKAIKRILNATGEEDRPVLCFVDEVLRGTNTVERIAASTQVLKSLTGKDVLCCACTHDVELTELLKEVYDNYHFEEDVVDGDVVFQYRLLKGKATTRNAIKLLEIMGYDQEIVSNAQEMARRFMELGRWENGK